MIQICDSRDSICWLPQVLQHLYQRYLQRFDAAGRKRVLLAYGICFRMLGTHIMVRRMCVCATRLCLCCAVYSRGEGDASIHVHAVAGQRRRSPFRVYVSDPYMAAGGTEPTNYV